MPKDNVTSDWRYFGLVLMIAPVLVWLSSSLWIWWSRGIYGLETRIDPDQWSLIIVLAYGLITGSIFYIPTMLIGFLLYQKSHPIHIFLACRALFIFVAATVSLFSGELRYLVAYSIVRIPDFPFVYL